MRVRKQSRKDLQLFNWRDTKTQRKFRKCTKTLRKVHQPGVMSRPAEPKARTVKRICLLKKLSDTAGRDVTKVFQRDPKERWFRVEAQQFA